MRDIERESDRDRKGGGGGRETHRERGISEKAERHEKHFY